MAPKSTKNYVKHCEWGEIMLKKVTTLVTSVAAMLLLSSCSGGLLNQTAEEGEELTWRITTHQIPGTSRFESTLPVFAEELSKQTDGKFTVEIYGGGTLFPVTETYDAVARGNVQAAAIFTGFWSSKDPVFNLITLPGDPISTPEEHFKRADALAPILNEVYAESGITYLGAFDYGPDEIFMSNKKIEKLEDFEGMSIRGTGVAAQFYDRLGASTVSIASPELYTALQLGTVDGAEFNDYLVNSEMGLHEVTDYVIEPALHTGPSSDKDLIVNDEAWESLPKSYQDAFIAARDKAREATAGDYNNANKAAKQLWIDAGVEISQLPEEEVQRSREVAYEWLAEYANKNESTEKYVTKYVEVLRELGYTKEADQIDSFRAKYPSGSSGEEER